MSAFDWLSRQVEIRGDVLPRGVARSRLRAQRPGDSRAFREQLEESARQTLEMDLGEKVCKAFAIDADQAEELLSRAEKQVSEGRFRFVVLMDRLDDRLKDLISFINENSRFDVFGVELQFYRFDDYEITIPKLYGAEVRKEVDGGSARRRWARHAAKHSLLTSSCKLSTASTDGDL